MTAARRDLLLICAGSAVSSVGNAVTLLSLSLCYRAHGPIVITAILIAGLLPVALGAPVAGALVDRWRNRRLLVGAQILQALTLVVLVFTVDNVPASLLLLVLLGCGTAVTMPAASALLPHITGEGAAARGYSWLGTGRSVGFMVGASLAGVLVAGPGIRAGLLTDAVSFAVLAFALLAVRTERDPRSAGPGADQPERGAALAGVRHLRRDPVLLISVIGLTIGIMVGVLDNIASVYLVTDELHAGEVAFGVTAAVWDIGMIIGGLLAGRLARERGLVIGLGAAGITMGVAFVGLAAASAVWMVAVGFLVGGFSNGLQNVVWQALVRLRTPEAIRGRVFAAASAALMTANVTGTVLGGPIVGLVGPRWAFAGAGTLTGLAGLVILPISLRVVRTERWAPVAELVPAD